MAAVDKLEAVVRNVRWKSADFVEPTEMDNCNTAINDAADSITNFAFDGVETINIYNDNTPSA